MFHANALERKDHRACTFSVFLDLKMRSWNSVLAREFWLKFQRQSDYNVYFRISGSHDHTVRVWSRPTYMCTLVLRGHSGPVLSLEADEEYVFSTATDM